MRETLALTIPIAVTFAYKHFVLHGGNDASIGLVMMVTAVISIWTIIPSGD